MILLNREVAKQQTMCCTSHRPRPKPHDPRPLVLQLPLSVRQKPYCQMLVITRIQQPRKIGCLQKLTLWLTLQASERAAAIIAARRVKAMLQSGTDKPKTCKYHFHSRKHPALTNKRDSSWVVRCLSSSRNVSQQNQALPPTELQQCTPR